MKTIHLSEIAMNHFLWLIYVLAKYYLDKSQNQYGKKVHNLRHGPRNLSRQHIANEQKQQLHELSMIKVKFMPGYWVDILCSDDGLLRQLRVVKAEMSWYSAPHSE